MLTIDSKIIFHQNVNIDPLGSHCSLCGQPTNSTLWFPVNWDERLTNAYTDLKGFYPVGSECAKKIDKSLVTSK